MKKLIEMIKNHWILIAFLLLLVWSYVGAFILGAEWRFIENFVVFLASIYCFSQMMKVGDSVGYVIAAACLGIGINGVIESTLFLLGQSGVQFDGHWYAFGNHIRNMPVIVMMLMLSGGLQKFADFLQRIGDS